MNHVHNYEYTYIITYHHTCINLYVTCFQQQRWAHAYRDLNFHRSVDTNNSTEALNKVLKYGYLPKRSSLTPSQIVILLLEQFLPDCYQKYLFQNFKLTSFNRSYKTFVPSYLHDRPRDVISYTVLIENQVVANSMERISMKLKTEKKSFKCRGKHVYTLLISDKQVGHRLVHGLDWIKHHIPCMFTTFEHKAEWSWNNLPQQYLSQPHLCADVSALQMHFSTTVGTSDPTPSDLQDDDTSLPCFDEIPSGKVQKNIIVYKYIMLP